MNTADHKPFWQSKTIWFNLLTILVALAAAPEIVEIASQNPGYLKGLSVVAAVGNILLRLFTTQPLQK